MNFGCVVLGRASGRLRAEVSDGVCMNWVLSVFGALVGVAVAEDRNFLGAVAGFFMSSCCGADQLRREVDVLRRELASSKSRLRRPCIAQGAIVRQSGIASPAIPPRNPRPQRLRFSPAPPTGHTDSRRRFSPYRPSSRAAPARATGTASAVSAPAAPGWEQKLAAKSKCWFTEGNVPVKIGVLVLLFGVAAALKYAAGAGLFHLVDRIAHGLIAAAAEFSGSALAGASATSARPSA